MEIGILQSNNATLFSFNPFISCWHVILAIGFIHIDLNFVNKDVRLN